MNKEFVNLATAYRPRTFAEVVGQELAVSALKRIAHSPGIACRSIFLKGSYGSGKCIDLEQRVSTSMGYLKGRDLVKGLSEGYTSKEIDVEQSDGTFRKTSHLFFQKGVKCLTLQSFYGKEFSATPEHPVLALKEGTLVPKMVKVSELKEGDFLLLRKPLLAFNLSKENLEEYKKYFIYGYCVGDACYSMGARGKVQVKGTFADMTWLQSYLRSKNIIRNDGNDYQITKDKRSKDCVQIQIPWRSVDFLSLLNLGENAYTKTLNEKVFSSKELAFVTFAGLLASDGSFTQSRVSSLRKRGLKKSASVEYSTSSPRLANDICDLLDYLGIIYSCSRRVPHFSYKGENCVGSDSYRIIIPSSFLKEVYSNLKELGSILDLPNSRMGRVFNFTVEDSKQQISKCSYSSSLRNKFWDWFNSKFNPQICRGNSTEPCQSCSGGKKRSYNSSFDCSYYRNFRRNLPNKLSPVTIANVCEFLLSQGINLTDSRLLKEDIELNVSLYRDYVYSPITSIKESICDVFDVTIPDTHLFISGNRVNHNTTIAKLFGRAMNCEKFNSLDDVCNECAGCKEAMQQNSQNYWEFDSSVVGNVDGIEKIKNMLEIPPSGRRVVVLDECHALSRASQNMLLKMVEDGVKDTIFVFASTDDVIETIKSRSICIDITTIPQHLIVKRLREVSNSRGIEISDEQLDMIALKSQGHLRNSLSTLQYYEMCGDKALDNSFQLVKRFLISSLSKTKHEDAAQYLDKLLLYPIIDIRDSINTLIKSIYLAEPKTFEDTLLRNGVADKLFSYFYSPLAVNALKSEAGTEILLRAFLDKTKPKSI